MDAPYHLIGQFLREHPDFFCVDCLAASIKAPPGQVSMATQRLLAGEAAFPSRLGVCSRCARRRTVIRVAAQRGGGTQRSRLSMPRQKSSGAAPDARGPAGVGPEAHGPRPPAEPAY